MGLGVEVSGYCCKLFSRRSSASSGILNRTLVSLAGLGLVGVDSILLSFRRNRGGDSGGFKFSRIESFDGEGGRGIVGMEYSLGNAYDELDDGSFRCRLESNR